MLDECDFFGLFFHKLFGLLFHEPDVCICHKFSLTSLMNLEYFFARNALLKLMFALTTNSGFLDVVTAWALIHKRN